MNQDFSFSFYQDIKKVIILQLLKEYSCSQEVRQTLNIFIINTIILLIKMYLTFFLNKKIYV